MGNIQEWENIKMEINSFLRFAVEWLTALENYKSLGKEKSVGKLRYVL